MRQPPLRPFRAVGICLTLLALAAPAVAQSDDEDPREGEPLELTTEQGRDAVGMFKVHVKEKKEPGEIIQLMEELATEGAHSDISKELVKFVKHRYDAVEVAAVKLLGTQRDEVARKALLKIAKWSRNYKPHLGPEAVKSLGYVGYGGKRGFNQLLDLFYAVKDNKVKRNIIKTFGQQKEKLAVPLLIALLDEPKPGSANAASNPPASFWQARYKDWRYLSATTVRSLEAIIGRRFFKSEDALKWVKTEGKKLGIKYERPRDPWVG